MNKIRNTIFLLISLFCFGIETGQAINVTFTIDEYAARPAGLSNAERNLAQLLSEVNRAQGAHSILELGQMKMDEFAKKSIASIWAVTPFLCEENEIVERCWVFKNGTMMVSHIPLIMKPEGETFGLGAYQEAVVEFDRNGRITDFRFAISPQLGESMEHCGVEEVEKASVIRRSLEKFRTAYCQKDIKTIEAMFSDDALIITGRVVGTQPSKDIQVKSYKVEYTKQTKEQYIRNLRYAFRRNKWIDVKFSDIGENGEIEACAGITRSKVDPTKFGVRVRQTWKSQNYSDEGYLFLLWEFPEDGRDPIIHVRTWQPENVGGKRQRPDDDISTLGGFDL
jgi:hypothetical protein